MPVPVDWQCCHLPSAICHLPCTPACCLPPGNCQLPAASCCVICATCRGGPCAVISHPPGGAGGLGGRCAIKKLVPGPGSPDAPVPDPDPPPARRGAFLAPCCQRSEALSAPYGLVRMGHGMSNRHIRNRHQSLERRAGICRRLRCP